MKPLLAALVVLLASCATDTPTVAPDTEVVESVTVSGTLLLIDSDIRRAGGECHGTGGYADITAGAQVVIRDRDGTTVGLGSLDPGRPESRVECRFGFVVDDVPAGRGIYSVEVSHRGEVSFNEDDADAVALTLS